MDDASRLEKSRYRKEERPTNQPANQPAIQPATVASVGRESAWEQKRRKGRRGRTAARKGRAVGRGGWPSEYVCIRGRKTRTASQRGWWREERGGRERASMVERKRGRRRGTRQGWWSRDGGREGGDERESRKRGKRVDIPGCTPWQSQRIAMATDPETPSGRRTIGASLSDGSNNVSSLCTPPVDVGRRTRLHTSHARGAMHAVRDAGGWGEGEEAGDAVRTSVRQSVRPLPSELLSRF